MSAINILIIEDDEDYIIYLKSLLEKTQEVDYNINSVMFLSDAIRVLEQQNIEVVLLDLMLPDSEGVQTFLRLNDGFPDIPIVVITGNDNQSLAHEALSHGAQDYIFKGIVQKNSLDRHILFAIERKKNERILRDSEARYLNLFQYSNDSIILFDKNGAIQDANYRAQEIFGYKKHEFIGMSIGDLHPDSSLGKSIKAYSGVGQSDVGRMETIYRRKNKREFNAEVTIGRIQVPEQEVTQLIIRDITLQKNAEKEILHLALHDPLTDLANRNLFMQRLTNILSRAERNKDLIFALLFIDLDGFKMLNDSIGHMGGDCFLLEIAHRLQRLLRKVDTVARLGGDEFTIILEDIKTTEQAILVARRVQSEISQPCIVSGQEVSVTASIGIAMGNSEIRHPDEIIKRADNAMYYVKRRGKGRYEVYNRNIHNIPQPPLELVKDLREAIINEDMELYYQPIMDLQSLKISGLEALIRWKHPEKGYIPPDVFIPLAENNGLILKLGYWILQEAYNQILAWETRGVVGIFMAVNISAKQIENEEFELFVRKMVTRESLKRNHVHFEITEGIAMGDVRRSIAIFEKLKSMNIQISIDDFGTGYSSLSYLRKFPIDTLKVDRSFIKDVCINNNDAAITRTILNMARSLNLNVVAEGVETEEQLSFLQKHGCRFAQGYYFNRPLPLEDITRVILSEKARAV